MQIGFFGLGKMGTRMVEKLLAAGHEVTAWNRSAAVMQEFELAMQDKQLAQKLTLFPTIAEVIATLPSPKVVWSMLPAGEATETILQEIAECVVSQDIVIDGGNAFYKDTERRFDSFKQRNVRFLGIGVSGGVHAPENGYPFMVGGDRSAYEYVTPLLDSLIQPKGGHTYFGTGGAGHFVKMVHNGIEYGMMQALGEGFGVLEKSPYELDLLAVARLWQRGTLVSGFLLDRAKDALEKNAALDDIEGVIDATGEAEWTVNQAKEEGVFIENIEQSLDFRKRSKTDKAVGDSYAARMVAALRREFGGHKVVKKES